MRPAKSDTPRRPGPSPTRRPHAQGHLTASERPDPGPFGARHQLSDLFADEAQAWIDGESALDLAACALDGWHRGEVDRGAVLAMLSEAGPLATRALMRGWGWLGEPRAA